MSDEVPKQKTPQDRLRAMADLLDHNPNAKFGGLALICPPPGGGEPIEQVLFDSAQDAAQFWTTLQFRTKTVLDDLGNAQRLASGGRR